MSRTVKKAISLSDDELAEVFGILRGGVPTQTAFRNATILKLAHQGKTPTEIANEVKISRQSVHKVINKYFQHGISACWADLERSGRPVTITDEAKRYVVDLAGIKPNTLGYHYELWSVNLLREHIKKHCSEQGFPELCNVSKSTVWQILYKQESNTHKIKYYLERTADKVAESTDNVLVLYKEVSIAVAQDLKDDCLYVSYNKKDQCPTIKHSLASPDFEYKSHSSLYLLIGIDLLSGKVKALVRERHRSYEFVELLKLLDATYAKGKLIKVVLDNNRARTSKETQAYIESKPQRFEFVLNPKNGSWLNIIEAWFDKLAILQLQGIRAANKQELERLIMDCIELINKTPMAPRWKCTLNDIDV